VTASAAGVQARAAAATAVHRVLVEGQTLERALAAGEKNGPAGRERAQARALAFGALRWHCRHRVLLRLLLDRPLRARDRILEALLSVALFELEHGRAPGYAAVSASVAAARRLGRPRAAPLVNAALRRYQREREALLARAQEDEEARHAHPGWLLQLLREAWPSHWEAICRTHQQPPPMWLRVNAARTTLAAYCEELAAAGLAADAAPAFADALCLREPVAVERLPGFDAGLVSVQDAAAQLAAALLSPAPGARVLDACAAPGGKTVHLLERAAGQLQLQALDVDAERLVRLDENLARAGFRATVLTGDAREPADWWDGEPFDRVLVDAPCSATGVIRRHPDIRFLRRPGDLAGLAERQLAILQRLWPLLRPGGRLLYVTCSVLPVENHGVGHRFLQETPDARVVGELPPAVAAVSLPVAPGRQLLPNLADTDGFYYLLLQKSIA
jgi:16S rRNA (cytosine967-C5)-methyltransferase